MEIKLARRMEGFQPGIFNVLDERKNLRLAQGLPVYNLISVISIQIWFSKI